MADPRDVVLVEGVRTPFVKSRGALKGVSAAELGRVALKELVEKANFEVKDTDDVIIGSTWNPPDTVNVARVISINAGIPISVPAATVNRFCASALEAVAIGFDRIRSGYADTIIAGGTESMSHMPWLFNREFSDLIEEFARARSLQKRINVLKRINTDHLLPKISLNAGLIDPVIGMNMGQTAEVLAKTFHVSRREQDEYALQSHLKAVNAQGKDRFQAEIAPVFIPPSFEKVIEKDIGPRSNQSLEALERLEPAFDDQYGTVTAGNACPVTDGAAMVLLMSREKAAERGYKPLASLRSYSFVGVDPQRMGLGPAYATPKALERAKIDFSQIGLIELNEAFAAQVLACQRAFESVTFAKECLHMSQAIGEIPMEILNVNGGALALGHPVAATGARLLITLAKEMQQQSVEFGLVAMSIGGGQGGAVILENEG
jgi:acetyl-CoA acyltransferase